MNSAGDEQDMNAGVPIHPLPVPAHVRLALLGDCGDRTSALEDLLCSTGRDCERFAVEDVQGRGRVLPADVVFLSCSLSVLMTAAPGLRLPLKHLVVVSTMAPSSTDRHPEESTSTRVVSAAQRLSSTLPLSRIVGALQQFGAEHLRLLELGALTTDVPLTGDDLEATDLAAALLDEIPGVDAIYAGPLRNSAAIEGIADVLHAVQGDLGRPVGFRLHPERGLTVLDGR